MSGGVACRFALDAIENPYANSWNRYGLEGSEEQLRSGFELPDIGMATPNDLA